jgi:hypothetical protein
MLSARTVPAQYVGRNAAPVGDLQALCWRVLSSEAVHYQSSCNAPRGLQPTGEQLQVVGQVGLQHRADAASTDSRDGSEVK